MLVDVARGEFGGQDSVEALRHGAIDGFLFFAVDPPASLERPDAPPVVVMEASPERFPHVRFDVDAGVQASLDHLHELGHRRIGHLRSAVRNETFDRRSDCWSAHLRANGVDPEAMPVQGSRFTADDAIAAGRELLGRLGDATAIICDDDVLASGLVVAAHELGVDVPGDVSITGFDDLDHARLVSPPLTTVRLDGEALGAAAFELLLARLHDREPESRVLPVELVVRGSTGPPRVR